MQLDATIIQLNPRIATEFLLCTRHRVGAKDLWRGLRLWRPQDIKVKQSTMPGKFQTIIEESHRSRLIVRVIVQIAIATKSTGQGKPACGACAKIDGLQAECSLSPISAPDPPCDIESVLSLLCSGPICRGKGRRERSLRSLPAPIFPGTEGCPGQAGGRGEVTSEPCS